MKHKINKAMIFSSGIFVGISLLIACGTITAEDVLSALDITFDSSGTALAADNVQDALKELDTNHQELNSTVEIVSGTSLPTVYDADGNELGIFVGLAQDGDLVAVYNGTMKGTFLIYDYKGEVNAGAFYFTTSDCTGTKYATRYSQIYEHNNQLFKGKPETEAERTINSAVGSGGSCTPVTGFTQNVYDVEELTSSFAKYPFPTPIQIGK